MSRTSNREKYTRNNEKKKCGRCKALRQVVFVIFKTLVDVISSSLPFVNLFSGYMATERTVLKSITDCSPYLSFTYFFY